MTETLSPTKRSTLRRHAERARLARRDLYEVLDAGLICHLGVVVDGAPRVVPTCYGRVEDMLYLHGSTGSVSLRTGMAEPVCVTVTLVDGIVYARSVFHHSANYRSAVVHGTPRPVRDRADKLRALQAIVEHTAPGSWEHARRPNAKELAATAVLALPLLEASVKIRTGGPVDDEADVVTGGRWAGVLPVHTTFGLPMPSADPRCDPTVPDHVARRSSR